MAKNIRNGNTTVSIEEGEDVLDDPERLAHLGLLDHEGRRESDDVVVECYYN